MVGTSNLGSWKCIEKLGGRLWDSAPCLRVDCFILFSPNLSLAGTPFHVWKKDPRWLKNWRQIQEPHNFMRFPSKSGGFWPPSWRSWGMRKLNCRAKGGWTSEKSSVGSPKYNMAALAIWRVPLNDSNFKREHEDPQIPTGLSLSLSLSPH